MNSMLDILFRNRKEAFKFFDRAFLFGSCLWSDTPNDIDILLVYESSDLMRVNLEAQKVAQLLSHQFPGHALDFTVVNVAELEQTRFLEKIPHKEIANW